MNSLFNIMAFSADAAAAGEVVEIVTQYSDKRVPVLNLIMIPVSIVLLIAVLITAFVMVRNRTREWGTGLITGITAYLLLGVISTLPLILVGYFEGLRDYFTARPTLISVLIGVFSLIIEILVLYYGMVYARYQYNKRNLPLNIGVALTFGLGFYAVMIFLSNQITTMFSILINDYWTNTFGFDQMVSSMVASGTYTEEGAIEALLELVNTNGFNYLLDALCTIMAAIQVTCVEVMIYGALAGKLEKKWIWYGIGFVAVSNIQSFVEIFVSNMWLLFFIGLVVTVVMGYLTVLLVRANMPDDIKMLTYTRQMQERDEDAKKKKMPKIVMPKD